MMIEDIVSHKTVRWLELARKEIEDAEEAFNKEAFANLPKINGKTLAPGVVVELLSGLQYEVRSISCYAHKSLNTMGITIQARRRYKEGRRAGHTANSTSFINFGDITDVVTAS